MMPHLLKIFLVVCLMHLFTHAKAQPNVIERPAEYGVWCNAREISQAFSEIKDTTKEIELRLNIEESGITEDDFLFLSRYKITTLVLESDEMVKYTPGLYLLRQVNNLEFMGFSHMFLKDIEKMPAVDSLSFKWFYVDSLITEKVTANQVKNISISLSKITDLSVLFSSLSGLQSFNMTKIFYPFDFYASSLLLQQTPVKSMDFSIVNFKQKYSPEFKKFKNLQEAYFWQSDLNYDWVLSSSPKLKKITFDKNRAHEKQIHLLKSKFPTVEFVLQE